MANVNLIISHHDLLVAQALAHLTTKMTQEYYVQIAADTEWVNNTLFARAGFPLLAPLDEKAEWFVLADLASMLAIPPHSSRQQSSKLGLALYHIKSPHITEGCLHAAGFNWLGDISYDQSAEQFIKSFEQFTLSRLYFKECPKLQNYPGACRLIFGGPQQVTESCAQCANFNQDELQ
ncbi:hypothetical protein THIAE_03325 [Thiomicrospira aerophila AL3]|uniref:Uncharacterized protein n=1 Tax=Thiomicrospira aerophila AL3 TaxID=717772 RepID=W0DUW1_9GAMM|nr:hypothetical protein [Thiomicrospira aerophila]AHF02212.1 hypothetical protein THIAE_03325 [Thiomicrospira aerophila AL3]